MRPARRAPARVTGRHTGDRSQRSLPRTRFASAAISPRHACRTAALVVRPAVPYSTGNSPERTWWGAGDREGRFTWSVGGPLAHIGHTSMGRGGGTADSCRQRPLRNTRTTAPDWLVVKCMLLPHLIGLDVQQARCHQLAQRPQGRLGQPGVRHWEGRGVRRADTRFACSCWCRRRSRCDRSAAHCPQQHGQQHTVQGGPVGRGHVGAPTCRRATYSATQN